MAHEHQTLRLPGQARGQQDQALPVHEHAKAADQQTHGRAHACPPAGGRQGSADLHLRGAVERARVPAPAQLHDGGHVHDAVVHVRGQARHAAAQEGRVHVHAVAGQLRRAGRRVRRHERQHLARGQRCSPPAPRPPPSARHSAQERPFAPAPGAELGRGPQQAAACVAFSATCDRGAPQNACRGARLVLRVAHADGGLAAALREPARAVLPLAPLVHGCQHRVAVMDRQLGALRGHAPLRRAYTAGSPGALQAMRYGWSGACMRRSLTTVHAELQRRLHLGDACLRIGDAPAVPIGGGCSSCALLPERAAGGH